MKYHMYMAVPAALFLSACGGGSTDDSPISTRTFAVDTPTPAVALAGGKTLVAQSGQVAAFETDYENEATELKSSTAGIVANSDGEVSLIVNGKTYAFKNQHRIEDDGEFYAYATDGEVDISADGNQEWKALISYSGDIGSFLDGSNTNLVTLFKYRDVEGPADDFTKSTGEVGYMVVGSETQAAALNTLTVKSYDAMLQAEIFPAEGFVSTQNRTEVRSSDLTFTVDFEQNTIEGVADNLKLRNRVRGQDTPSFSNVEGQLTFASGSIDGADFTGSLAASDTLKSELSLNTVEGSYSGSFYGTEAQAIGGVISGTSTGSSGNTSTFIGGFVSN